MSSSKIDPGPATVADRRTRGRERRRAALYVTAIELFIEKGYENTTMEDIADRADVARATVFNYFPRKVTLVEEWAGRRRKRASEAAAQVEDLEDASLRSVLVRYVTEMAAMSSANRAESVALLNAAVPSTSVWSRNPLADELSRFVAQARANGEIDQHTDPGRVGLLLASSHFATLVAWIGNDPPPFDITEEVIATVDIVLNGIMPRSQTSPEMEPPGPPLPLADPSQETLYGQSPGNARDDSESNNERMGGTKARSL